jgi:hydrogenase-4 component F
MIGWVVAAPLVAAIVSIAFRGRDVRRVVRVALAGACTLLPFVLVGQIDALSLAFAALVSLLGFLSTAYSAGAFSFEWGAVDTLWSRKSVFFVLLGAFWSAMLLVVLADNFALLWLGLSATTLATAFLVGYSGEAAALEAAWKYLILCSMGIAFALIGIIVLARAWIDAGIDPARALTWVAMFRSHAPVSAPLARLALTLMVVGFATKAGLVPMHTWLPDAHSKAPPPVSALLSGVLVSCALYAIVRSMAVGTAVGVGPQIHLLLTWLGALSTIVAGALMLAQNDLKRLLAYSTVEHAGIVALALGFGGPLGLFAALFHIVAHAFSKSAAFLSAGLVQREHGTTRIGELHALWSGGNSGKLLLAALTALSGMPPFGIFVGELLVVMAGVAAHSWVALAAGVLGVSLAFAALSRTAIQIESGRREQAVVHADVAAASGTAPRGRILSRAAFAATAFALVVALAVAVVPWIRIGDGWLYALSIGVAL